MVFPGETGTYKILGGHTREGVPRGESILGLKDGTFFQKE